MMNVIYGIILLIVIIGLILFIYEVSKAPYIEDDL